MLLVCNYSFNVPSWVRVVTFVFETEFSSVALFGLELTDILLHLPPSGGMKGVYHHTWPPSFMAESLIEPG